LDDPVLVGNSALVSSLASSQGRLVLFSAVSVLQKLALRKSALRRVRMDCVLWSHGGGSCCPFESLCSELRIVSEAALILAAVHASLAEER